MLKVILRTVVMYFIVSLGVRLMGKRQIGDMQPTELVITLLISEIAAIPLQDISQPVSLGVASIFILVFLEIIASVVIMKNLRLRRVLAGKAMVVVKNGKVDQKAMKSVRMTVPDLVEMLRMQGVFDISEVDTAILEINGTLSVRQKLMYSPATVMDVNPKKPDSGMPMTVISDGKIIHSSLKFLNIDIKTLDKILSKKGVNAADIFIMTLDFEHNSVIIMRDKSL